MMGTLSLDLPRGRRDAISYARLLEDQGIRRESTMELLMAGKLGKGGE